MLLYRNNQQYELCGDNKSGGMVGLRCRKQKSLVLLLWQKQKKILGMRVLLMAMLLPSTIFIFLNVGQEATIFLLVR